MLIEYFRLRGESPTRANPSDAGLDLPFNPDDNKAVEAMGEDYLYNHYPITISDRGDGALGSTDGKRV
jgi:hypothetical protein